MDVLNGLNEPQRRAVETIHGPLLILAGPGSGKTRVISHRVAYLAGEADVPPWHILAVTFTNKAASEMRERVLALLGEMGERVTMGTFHAICTRILRAEGENIQIPRSFTIYDHDDQLSLVKQAMQEADIDVRRNSPRSVLSAISRAKAEMSSPEAYARQVASYFDELVARVYSRYQSLLEANSALDFDDLLMQAVVLFRECPAVLEKYQERYQYIHIDEFQDTNVAQYMLARQLAAVHNNICVVGDPDQSVYTWRAADLRNILNFERDFPNAQVVYLEQNYRSTQTILDSAHCVISANLKRKEKKLWTENGQGLPVVVHESYGDDDEAEFVVSEIESLLHLGRYSPGSCSVMYRTNSQSRPFEDALVRHGIPYRLVGGTRFYERREVKDIIAFLRLAHNPFDSLCLLRVINVPPRGIGQRTVEGLMSIASRGNVPPYAALQMFMHGEEGLSLSMLQPRARAALIKFLELLNEFIQQAHTIGLSQLVDAVIDRIGYRAYLTSEYPDDAEERWENIEELRAVASQYDELMPSEAISRFLEDVSLVADVDTYDQRADAVTLITLHAAKGLEFPVVFVVGMEEGRLPHIRSFDDPDQMEEERRLCYVGITRTKERLYLTRAFRRAFGAPSLPSRFLKDIPLNLINGRPESQGKPMGGRARAGAGPAQTGILSPEPAFVAGDRVRHVRFGDGVVVSCQADGTDQVVTVAFKGDAGVKKLLLSLAPLERTR